MASAQVGEGQYPSVGPGSSATENEQADRTTAAAVSAGSDLPQNSGVAAPAVSSDVAPIILAYLVGPLAFGALVVLRHFGYVARLSLWAYLGVLVVTAGISL